MESVEEEINRKELNAPRVTPERIEGVIQSAEYYNFPASTVTICLLTLKNGYSIVGESACASPENFDVDVGQRIARDNAKQKIWQLEGYLLRDSLNTKATIAA